MELGVHLKIEEPRIEFWFEKYQHHVNLYQRSDEGILRCVHKEEYDRTRGLEGCIGVGIISSSRKKMEGRRPRPL